MEPKVDVIVTEMRNTTYRQPSWYRYAAGFGGDKPVVVVENPYGGVVPELVEMLKVGRGYDLFRTSLYEAAALGANMTVPYGAWMGSVIQDAFYPPHELCVEIQSFLADHEDLFSTRTWSEVAVVFSIESNFQLVARRDLMADNRENVSGEAAIPFAQVTDALSDAAQPYDVVFFPDGELREDSLTAQDLAWYRVLVLPACHFLTEVQARLLREYLDGGGNLVVLGELGTNLPRSETAGLLDHPACTTGEPFAFSVADVPGGPQVRIEPVVDVALNVHRVDRGAALQFIRYGYDREADAVPLLPELTVDVRFPERFGRATAFSPGPGTLRAALESHVEGAVHRLKLSDVPLYGVVFLER